MLTLKQGQEEHLVLVNPHNATLSVEQKAGSSLLLHVISLDGQDSTLDFSVRQGEEGCSTRLYGLGILSGKQQFGLTTRVHHAYQSANGNGFSDQLFKYVLLDEAQGSFYGELKVLPDAQKTEAHQTNRNILLSPHAKMQTRPQLEIYADDVKCSHGATTGQLDEQALFYMQQRGISRRSAQRLLLLSFLSEALNGLPDEMKERYLEEISGKL